ncbi:CAAX amino terminal protease family [Aciduliprofundum sp. MAR08-339]|uniref:CPBP family intramembrane glutamic endopeptidase n=1 Tax=Aciduliprofundum sp. (strain MAR08-339) TaxID=673860 RepID=UPI0002A4BDCA|nr:CAAX amino terminal protease family [Aciduliprofundum sp. MAR08-339]
MQVISLATTLILAYMVQVNVFGSVPSLKALGLALLFTPLAILVPYLTNLEGERVSYKPPENFVPEKLWLRILLFIILAPISEEILYRGLLEGYLILHTSSLIAILVPAVLFSIIHYAPFKNAPKNVIISILLSSLILGIIAGWLRAYSNSIIPAIIVHGEFNIIGVRKG